MRPIRAGIQTKMTLAFSAVFILLAVVFNINSYQRLRAILVEDNDQYLLSRATSLLEKTDINPVIIPLPDKNNFVRIFYHSGGEFHPVFESPGTPAHIPIPASTGVTDTLGLRIAYVRGGSRSSSEDNPAELQLITSAAPLQLRIHSLINLLFISSLFSVLIAGGFSWLVAGAILRPLQRIIEAARTISTNRLRDLIPGRNTHDELQELTETLNAMLQRIDDSLRQQQGFFASASHELKTPLAILRTELEVNLNRPGLPDNIRQLLYSQLHEIKRLQDSVGEFLVVSQLKEGTLTLRPEAFDLSADILRTFNLLKPLLEAKRLTPEIRFDPEADDFMLSADEDKIAMVLLNLLENAAKYALTGTTIRCIIRKPPPGTSMLVRLENTTAEGSIDTTLLREAFFRAHTLQQGAGLGLWLCNEIVRLHMGKLLLDSADHLFSVILELPTTPGR